MNTTFPSDFFIRNRTRLQDAVDTDAPIVVTAHGQLQSNADNTFPFRQDSNFWYLTGLERPDYVLVLYKDETYIIAPSYNPIKDTFDGALSFSEVTQISGIKRVYDIREGWARLTHQLSQAKQVATLSAAPPYIASFGIYTNPARARLVRRLKRSVPGLTIRDIRKEMGALRVVKQPLEIAAIQHAIDITCETLNDVQRRSYEYEYEIDADIAQGFRRRGANGHAFSSIVAGGHNACTLHYLENNAKLNDGELVLADVGANDNYYAADLTRTWSRGKPTDRQRAVHDAVNAALLHGVEQLKPGSTFHDAEQSVREFVGKKLHELGLIQTITPEAVYEFYPHAPHYLGLDVHDTGDYNQPIVPGMVMTIEPGIYIPEERIGIRIEEDILITETGATILSTACPRDISPVQ